MPDKVYVSILAICNQDGTTKPLGVIWPDGRKFGIDNVLDIRQAASYRAGGTGKRYTCEIFGKVVFLFDEEGRWFWRGGLQGKQLHSSLSGNTSTLSIPWLRKARSCRIVSM